MKKIMGLFLIVASVAVISAACTSKNSNTGISLSKDGFYVMQDSEPVTNHVIWNNFLKTATKDNDAEIRMVNFYTNDNNSPYYIDLFFSDGFYYMFDNSSNNQEKQLGLH